MDKLTREVEEFTNSIERTRSRRAFLRQAERIGPESAMAEYIQFTHAWIFGGRGVPKTVAPVAQVAQGFE